MVVILALWLVLYVQEEDLLVSSRRDAQKVTMMLLATLSSSLPCFSQ